jgi:hypothetical protein
MMGRRIAAVLGVLLLHAALHVAFRHSLAYEDRRARATLSADDVPRLILVPTDPVVEEIEEPEEPPRTRRPRARQEPRVAAAEPTAPASPESHTSTRGFIDWPIEARESAARVLAAEREAERIARMFAGPDGTWASLTKRQRSQLNKFKWKPGVEGLKYDEQGNAIYTLPSGCTIVNFMFFGCPLGKPKIHDDMFDNMRLYFDEQRLPELKDGNGTEPEARRPPR